MSRDAEASRDRRSSGISDDELTIRFNEAIRIENEISKAKGAPVVRYDGVKKIDWYSFLEYKGISKNSFSMTFSRCLPNSH